MTIRPIRSAKDHAAALARIGVLWNAAPGTAAGAELDLLVDLVERYEDRHFPILDAGPVEIRPSPRGTTDHT